MMDSIIKKPEAEAEHRSPDAAPFRAQPNSIEETGIGFGQLTDLCVKIIYQVGRISARDIADRLCEAGRFGRKTGAGWSRYEGGKREVDPFVTALVEEASKRRGLTRRPILRR